MNYRKLGKDGPEITTLGFGMWAIGGSWGPQNDQDSIDAVHAALDHGINWFDTAAVYGLGHSEEILARALGNRRKDVIIATKFSLVWDDEGNVSNNATYDSIIRECEVSLRRLNTDYIDLYQQHWPDTKTNTPVEESMQAVKTLIEQGKVRYAGVSNFDIPLLQRATSVLPITSLQPRYNLLDQYVETSGLLPFCRENGVGVVAYSPLASGLLGGRYTPETTFSPDDWRSSNPNFSSDGLRRNLAIVDRLKEIAARHGKTVAQLAIAWVLSNPAVTSAIVGVRRPSHILDALPAADWELDDETKREIEQVLQSETAGVA